MITIVVEECAVGVEDNEDGTKSLHFVDGMTGMRVIVPGLHQEGCEQLAAKLRGSGLVVAPANGLPDTPG